MKIIRPGILFAAPPQAVVLHGWEFQMEPGDFYASAYDRHFAMSTLALEYFLSKGSRTQDMAPPSIAVRMEAAEIIKKLTGR